jgi:hypothetical protein
MTGDNTKIHHNYAELDGGGIYCSLGGKVYMTGEYAEVSSNAGFRQTGGVYIDGSAGYFEMSGAHTKINGNQGGGAGGGLQVYRSDATADDVIGLMSGEYAEISDNYCMGNGGGVFVQKAQFTMSGKNAKISGNTTVGNADNVKNIGGGVYVRDATSLFTMSGENAAIMNNNAAFSGGGVYLENSAQFTMNSGLIVNNTSSNFSMDDNNGVSGRWPQGTKVYTGLPGSVRSSATQLSDGSSEMSINNYADNLWAER